MKQAYLICAHNNFNLLKQSLMQLDDCDNDLYVHIDKKVRSFDSKPFEDLVKKSYVCFIPERISIVWGGYSQLQGNLLLLEAALNHGEYDYLHLISGVDFPIKSNDNIKKFLESYQGKEFVGFSPWHETMEYKLGYYHLVPMNLQCKYEVMAFLSKLSLKIQHLLHIHHHINTRQFCKGCNWWSITGKLARALVDNKKEFEKTYKHTLCSDEIFVQTYIEQHEDEFNVYDRSDEYKGCLRLIDWNRGNPYIWKSSDIEELMNSQALFARKFDESDMTIIQEIKKRIR